MKEKWVAALRSGDYTQAQDALRRTIEDENGSRVGYCCLGVLCNLYIKDNPGAEWVDSDDGATFVVNATYFDTNYLPSPVMEWAGLDETDPHVRVPTVTDPFNERRLSHLNDNGNDFERIANLIEESL